MNKYQFYTIKRFYYLSVLLTFNFQLVHTVKSRSMFVGGFIE